MVKGYFDLLLIATFLISSSYAHVTRSNATRSNASGNGLQNDHKQILSELTKVNQIPQSRGHEWDFGHYGYGGGDLAYGKSDYYWLIPLVIVIGFGALLLPLLGTLMTTMVTSGALTLTAGRKKRNIDEDSERISMVGKSNTISETFVNVLTQLERAMNKYGNEINEKYIDIKSN